MDNNFLCDRIRAIKIIVYIRWCWLSTYQHIFRYYLKTAFKINLKVFFHIFYLYLSWGLWKNSTLLSIIFFCFNRYLIVDYSNLHNKLRWQIAHHLPSLPCCADPTNTCHKWKTISQRIFFINDVVFLLNINRRWGCYQQ